MRFPLFIRFKHFLIVTLFILFSVGSFGQKYMDGKIMLVSGEVLEGKVQVPKKSSMKGLYYKKHNKSSEKNIKTKEIEAVLLSSKNGNNYLFECLKITNIRGNKIEKNKRIMFVVEKGYATLYFIGDSYKLDRKGNILVMDRYNQGTDLPFYYYYLRRKGEDIAAFFAMTSPAPTALGLNKILKKNAQKYLSDYPELVKRIKNKEFKHKNVEEIIRIYNEYLSE